MKYIIFLDVDGVLNSESTKEKVQNFVGIDDINVQNLAALVKRMDEVSIVLTTTWAEYWQRDVRFKEEQDVFANVLDAKLAKFGLHAIDKIDDCVGFYRGESIYRYLSKHPECEGYVILDDEEFDFEKIGLLMHHLKTYDNQGAFKESMIDYAEMILKGGM